MEKEVTEEPASVSNKTAVFKKKHIYIYISSWIISQTHMWGYRNNRCVAYLLRYQCFDLIQCPVRKVSAIEETFNCTGKNIYNVIINLHKKKGR
jgi:hypothetical protein